MVVTHANVLTDLVVQKQISEAPALLPCGTKHCDVSAVLLLLPHLQSHPQQNQPVFSSKFK